jgi:4-amino-4-deoxy-L-arabinose transferase-like glycosyltransferase
MSNSSQHFLVKLKSFFAKKYIKHSLLLLSVLALFLAFRWNTFNAPWERDEGDYAYSAWILDQGLNPYEDSISNKSPLVHYTYWLAYKINPDALWPPKLLSAIFVFGTTLLLGLIAKKEFGPKMAYPAMFLSVPMLAFYLLAPFAANTENFMLFPLVALLAIFVYFRDSDKKWPWLFFGVLSSLAFFYKPICLYVIVFIFFFWMLRNFATYKKISFVLLNFIFFLAGFLSVSFLILLPFLMKNWLASLWEWTVWWNYYHSKTFSFNWLSLKWTFINFLAYWWVLVALMVFYVFKRPKMWIFYLSLFSISFFTVFTTILHNYLLIIPFWVLMATASIKIISEFLCRKLKSKYTLERIRNTLTFSIVIIIIFPVANSLMFSPERFNIMVYGVQPFEESVAVAKYVRENTKPDDFIFSNGSELEILYYAKRKHSSRFNSYFPMYEESPKKEEYNRIYQEEISKNVPELIVYIISKNGVRFINIDYIEKEMKDHYNFIGGVVREGEKVYWTEKFPEEENNFINQVLLYKKDSSSY